jgi:heterodisulfide reductase subunit A
VPLCTVELFDGRRTRYVTACNYPIWEGMEVTTDSEMVTRGASSSSKCCWRAVRKCRCCRNWPKYGIDKPRFKAEDDTCILCGLCTRMCEKMGASAITLTGRGVDMKVDTPFHLQTDLHGLRCLRLGVPHRAHHPGKDQSRSRPKRRSKPIPSEYDMGLKGRKPVYVPYAQAVPNTPAIDQDVCVHFKTGGCQVCTEFCGVDAIDHTMKDEIVELEVGSVILAPASNPSIHPNSTATPTPIIPT